MYKFAAFCCYLMNPCRRLSTRSKITCSRFENEIMIILAFWSPDFRRIETLEIALVRPFVRSSERYLRNRSLFFYEILTKDATLWVRKRSISVFWEKKSSPPRHSCFRAALRHLRTSSQASTKITALSKDISIYETSSQKLNVFEIFWRKINSWIIFSALVRV